VAGFARSAVGVDLSGGMLAQARARGLTVAQGSITALPCRDASFDVVYSVKVLAHVAEIERALAEMARVTRPGGRVVAEFYNPWSLRYLVKRLKPPSRVSATTDDEAVYTRYDSLGQIRSYLPPELELEGVRGIRILTPVSQVHELPVVGKVLRAAEHALADQPVARNLGGFLVAIARKR
jgi:SAM-dependent methyltransferase